MPTAWLRTSSWPGPGWGVGISSSLRTAGPPYSETRIAFMVDAPLWAAALDETAGGAPPGPEHTARGAVGGSGRGRGRRAHPERGRRAKPPEIRAAPGAAPRTPARPGSAASDGPAG